MSHCQRSGQLIFLSRDGVPHLLGTTQASINWLFTSIVGAIAATVKVWGQDFGLGVEMWICGGRSWGLAVLYNKLS